MHSCFQPHEFNRKRPGSGWRWTSYAGRGDARGRIGTLWVTEQTETDGLDGHKETEDFSEEDNDSLPSPLASSDSLPSITEGFAELTLGPKKPRKGQFGYKDLSLPPSSPSTSSTLSDIPGDFFWDQLPGHDLDTPPTSPLLGTTPPIVAPAVLDDSSDEEMPSDFFYGDNRDDDPVPGDYLKSTMNKFKEASSNEFKCERLANGFATGSFAEKWYDKLDANIKDDWKLLKAAFLMQWPPETVPELSTEQHRARLRAERLKKEDIGKVVIVRGMETTGHAAWANRILALSARADDPSGAMIHGIRDGMPAMMKKIVTMTFISYKAFCDAVGAVDDDTIAVAMEEETRLTQVENDTRRLRDELAQARRAIPTSPTAPLRAAFGGFALGRGGAPRVPAPANTDADPFGGGPVRGANPPRGYQRGAAQVRGGGFRVQAWRTANPTKYLGGDEFAPYPLTPGTDAVGTGECFDCGVRHVRDSPHPRAIVDTHETYYRRVANGIIHDDRQATNVANAAGVPANVHLVHVEATAEYQAHWIAADMYGQGNGDGPEV
ncbi:hypothetical protein B0H14DRAFT_2595374 [Mycena olivaceomarginata]|nr:hypothetical protein B0H14DRAFT_2595374 [Mycena olivaceomarginata]